MLEELEPSHQRIFKGLYDRGDSLSIPPDYFRICNNCRFFTGGFETRWGTSVSIAVPTGVRRWFPYKIEGQANRLLYLDLNGKIYDSLYPGTPILNIPNMIDFSMAVFNGRAYISPHDRKRGLAGQIIYLYQGGGLSARPAAGAKPAGFDLQVTVGSQSGSIETGKHLFAVAYETDSGFITRPGPERFAEFDATGGTTALITNISNGPPGTVAKHILSTQSIFTYNGDQFGPELFFVPNGTINDNTTTSLEVDFYDADLVKSADYLLDEMETIPAVLGMTSYAGSLVGWGVNTDPSTVYVSKANEPESIDLIEGGIQVDVSEAGGVRNCLEYRGDLLIFKDSRSYITKNNGQEPVFWGFDSLDRGVGTQIFGIATILDEEGHTVDRAILADRRGLLLYDGSFETELSYTIKNIWNRITRNYFDTIQVALDSINQGIYCAVPLDGANAPNAILYCDYSEGLAVDAVKWSIWTFPYAPSTVGIDLDDNRNPTFKIGSINANLYKLDSSVSNDNGIAIPDPTWQTRLTGSEEVAVNHYGGVRLRCVGNGALRLSVSGLDDSVVVSPPSLNLSTAPGRFLEREFNLSSQLASIKGWTSSINEKFRITRITTYYADEYSTEPQNG